MRLIEAALSDDALSGMVISGAAGVGKSRLAREALAWATSSGFETRWAVGTSSARSLPLGTFASWAEPQASDNLQLVSSVIDALTSASPRTPVVVGVDDAHLLDDLSAFVLHQIVQRRAAKVVLTVRDGEAVSPPTREVWRGEQFERLDLQPLSRHETTKLLIATLGGSVAEEAASGLWKLTHGNVLYLRNIVEHEVAEGRLFQDDGCWRWRDAPSVPPGLIEMIETRIGALPRRVEEVVDMLAVAEPIELATLTRIADPAAVEQADTRGLLTLETFEGGVHVRVAHPLYGEVRRRSAPPTRLRRLRGLVAAELATRADRDDTRMVVRRAALMLDSDRAPDPELLVRAAQAAVWLADLPLADRLTDAAVRAGGEAEAKFIRSHVLTWLGRGQEGDEMLTSIVASDLTDADRARLAFLQAVNRLFTLPDPKGAKELIDNAARATPTHARAYIDAFLALYWAVMGKPNAARQYCEDLVPAQLPDSVAARMTAWGMAVAFGDYGRIASDALAVETGKPLVTRSFVAYTDARVGGLLLAGRIQDASDAAEWLGPRLSELGDVGLLVTGVAGRAALGGGHVDTACSLLRSAVEGAAPAEQTIGWKYRYQLPMTIALAMHGLSRDASVALETLELQRHTGWQWLDYELALARAWVSVSYGAVSTAIRILSTAAETCCANEQFAAEVMCLQTAAQFGDGSGAPRLRALTEIVDGPRVRLAALFATALHRSNAGELAALSEDFERMGDLVAAIDAAAHAAVAYRRQNLRGPALKCSARAEALAGRCGVASTPALCQAVERLPLSDREREIVILIGEGLSNRAVAERLTLSRRTVEGHIYRAMSKTGSRSREELAALFPRYPPRRK